MWFGSVVDMICDLPMVGCNVGYMVCPGHENGSKNEGFLRDGIASGRGVHRFWGVRIQESRSNLGLKT